VSGPHSLALAARSRRGLELSSSGARSSSTTRAIATTTSSNANADEPRAPTLPETAGMASDEDYMSFLDKANADPAAGYKSSDTSAGGKGKSGKVELKTVSPGAKVPREIQAATEKEEWIYVSDADEPFVGVSLALSKAALPDEEAFAALIGLADGGGEITIHDVTEWDRRGQYRDVVEATRKACKGGDVRVYRVPRGGPRVEYWVVGVDGEAKRLVGAKALGIES